MATFQDVGGQQQPQFMGPDAAKQSRRLAEMLMNEGMNTQGLTHWTQALGKVLQSGVGALRNDQATADVRDGSMAGNKALAQMLAGGAPDAAMANPYSAPQAMQMQVSDRNASRSFANQKALLQEKLRMQNADPMRQAQIEKLRAEIAKMGQPDEMQQLQMENIRSQIEARKMGGAAGMKARTEAEQKIAGKQQLSDQLGSMVSTYLKLDEEGGVSNPDRNWSENVKTWAQTNPVGQAIGRAVGSDTQSLRERIVNMRPLLVQQIRQASGMSARGMDSNRELEFYLQSASDPTKDVYSNLAAIAVLDKTYGQGNILEVMRDQGQIPQQIYERVKTQADIDITNRPIPQEPTAPAGAMLPGVDVLQDPADVPPVPGARKAPDGNYYVPDPNRPGKYMMVE